MLTNILSFCRRSVLRDVYLVFGRGYQQAEEQSRYQEDNSTLILARCSSVVIVFNFGAFFKKKNIFFF